MHGKKSFPQLLLTDFLNVGEWFEKYADFISLLYCAMHSCCRKFVSCIDKTA